MTSLIKLNSDTIPYKEERFGYCGNCNHEEFKLPIDSDDNVISISCAKCGYTAHLSTSNLDKQF